MEILYMHGFEEVAFSCLLFLSYYPFLCHFTGDDNRFLWSWWFPKESCSCRTKKEI